MLCARSKCKVRALDIPRPDTSSVGILLQAAYEDIEEKIFAVDPMLATGGRCYRSNRYQKSRGETRYHSLCPDSCTRRNWCPAPRLILILTSHCSKGQRAQRKQHILPGRCRRQSFTVQSNLGKLMISLRQAAGVFIGNLRWYRFQIMWAST